MFEDLVDSLKSIATRCSVARDASDSAAVPKDAHWITTEKGHHVLIRNKDGKPVAGNSHVLAAMTGKGDVRYSIPHIFTGSSASYEKPSLVHVGEGEGSQVYGWGLYGSDQRGVAEMYADNAVNYDAWKGGRKLDLVFPDNLLEAQTAKALIYFKGDVDAAIADFKRRNRGLAIVKELEEHGSEYKVTKNKHVYEQTFFTNRAPGDESHLLSWYDPVSKVNLERIVKALNADSSLNNEYSRTLLKKAKTAFLANLSNRIGEKGIEEATGSDVYKSLSELYKANRERSASEFLARAGIDGIKYPVDSYGSKTIKNGDEAGWNYVSFRDDNIRVDRKWVDGKEVATVGSMVKALKEWIPGMEVDEVDSSDAASGLGKADAPVRAQAAMAATGNLETDHGGVSGLRDRIVNTKGVRLDKSAITPEIDAAMKRWFASEKTKDARALAHVILDTMPWHDRVISVPGVGRIEITAPGIQDILTHTKPGTDASVRAVLQAINAKDILTNGTVFYRETKSGRKIANIICNTAGDGNGFSVISLKQGRPEEEDYRLHAATSVENNKASRTKESDPEGAGLNYTTGALSARIIAQGILENQWESEGDFKSWLKSVGGSSDAGLQPTKVIRNSEGKVAGFYNRKTGRVSLVKGVATPDTVAHEISWHATFHWAEKNHPELHKTLMRYAKEAPSGIEQSVRERYDGMNLSPEALLDEIGAERFTREDLSPILDGVAKKQAEGWFDKVEDAQDEARGAFVKAHTKGGTARRALPKEEIDRIAALPPKEAVAALVRAMLEGRSLSAKDAATDSANVPCGALLEALRRIADAASS